MTWLKKLVEQYRHKDEIAEIFGVIIYTDKHANIKKVLRDEDYWNSFDELSGPHWLIFSIRPVPGKYVYPSPPPGVRVRARMVPVWKEPKENMKLLAEFELDYTSDDPQFLVFADGGEDGILKHSLRLKDYSIDNASL